MSQRSKIVTVERPQRQRSKSVSFERAPLQVTTRTYTPVGYKRSVSSSTGTTTPVECKACMPIQATPDVLVRGRRQQSFVGDSSAEPSPRFFPRTLFTDMDEKEEYEPSSQPISLYGYRQSHEGDEFGAPGPKRAFKRKFM